MKDAQIDSLYEYIKQTKLTEILSLSQEFDIRFLAQGEYNKNFIIEDGASRYVLRLNFGSQIQQENQIAYEANTLRCLESSSVTPRLYFVDDSRKHIPYGLLVMEYLEGRSLDYRQDISKAAYIFKRIHCLEINEQEPKGHIVEKHLFSDRIKEAEYLLKEVWDSAHLSTVQKNILDRIFNYAQSNKHKEQYYIDSPYFCLNNTEVNSKNFIISDTNSYLVDWEKAVVSDPCQDLMHFLANTTTLWKTDVILSDEDKEQFFSEYERDNPKVAHIDIRERVRLYQPYLYLRAISWCAYAYIEYQKPDKDIQNTDTLEKIKEYLEPNFMEDLYKNELK